MNIVPQTIVTRHKISWFNLHDQIRHSEPTLNLLLSTQSVYRSSEIVATMLIKNISWIALNHENLRHTN